MEKKNTNNGTPVQNKEKEKGHKREQAVITCSAVMVMAALTLTGMYINHKGGQKNHVQEEQIQNNDMLLEQEMEFLTTDESPPLQIVDSGMVENPGRTGITAENIMTPSEGTLSQTPATATSKNLMQSAELMEQSVTGGVDSIMFSFNGIQLYTPLTESAEILIPYSMDQAVYFETLDQYKYNPAIVVAAEIDAPVCSLSAGKIVDKYWDYETGWTIEMDLGGGFKAYYGQLNNDTLEKTVDTYVAAGDVLGYVDVPTKYYAKEGTNVYFAMTKDGKPINPMEYTITE